MASYWVQFAKTGNPNRDGNSDWPSYDGQSDELLEFTPLGTAAARERYEANKLDFWDELDASGWSYPRNQSAPATSADAQTSSSNPQ